LSELPGLLRLHWQLETQPFPLQAMRERLDRLSREAPEDDRVWLGRADLALRTGDPKSADDLLKRCESRPPRDPDALRARLPWALAAGRPDQVVAAASHLPPSALPPADRAAMIARLAEFRGDSVARRQALERQVALRPGDPAAWGQLADMAAAAGDRDRVAEFRRRKAEVDRDLDAYRMMIGKTNPSDLSRASGLAGTAEAVGRRFEARSWWAIRERQAPGDREAREALDRLAPIESDSTESARTLADLIPPPLAAPSARAAAGPVGSKVPIFRDDADA